MNSLYVRSVSMPGLWVWLNVLAALFLAACSYLGQSERSKDLLLWGILPLSWALVSVARYPWNFWLEMDDEGVVGADGVRLPYAHLQSVQTFPGAAHNGNRGFPINAVFNERVISIPPRLNVPSKAVLDFLTSFLPRQSSPHAVALLQEFHREQTDAFGGERVWSCCGRARIGQLVRGRGFITVVLGVILMLGLLSVIEFVQRDETKVLPACIGFSFFGGMLILGVVTAQKQAQNKWGPQATKNGIVIAPVGLAVSQGDLLGQLGWEEIQRVTYPLRRRGLQITRSGDGPGTVIELKVAGAVIHLYDIYDRPLDAVHARIMQNWRPSR